MLAAAVTDTIESEVKAVKGLIWAPRPTESLHRKYWAWHAQQEAAQAAETQEEFAPPADVMLGSKPKAAQ
jgi:hypothetical protein